jgi:hypothetical protein
MANAAKYAAGAVGNLTAHFERKKDDCGEYAKFGNTNIDPSRTPLNYNLAPERGMTQAEYIAQRKSEVRCLKRADVNVMCAWIVTLPKVITRADGGVVDADRAEREFFEKTYQFLEKRYGGVENVISAYVHKDEATPHMHFAFVPVVRDKKRGDLKVSASEVIDRAELQRFHGELDAHLNGPGGAYRYEVQNEATKDGNKTVAQLKAESRKAISAEIAAQELGFDEAVGKMHEQLHEVQSELADKEDQVFEAENKLSRLERDIRRVGADAEQQFDDMIAEKAATLTALEAKIETAQRELTRFERFIDWADKKTGGKLRALWETFIRADREGRPLDAPEKPQEAPRSVLADLARYKEEIARKRQEAEKQPAAPKKGRGGHELD